MSKVKEALESAKIFIKIRQFINALEILRTLENNDDLLNNASYKKSHHQLMLSLLHFHQEMQDLEKSKLISEELGFLYLQFGKLQEANEQFQALYHQNPNNHNALYGLIKSSLELDLNINMQTISALENSLTEFVNHKEQIYEILGDFYSSQNKHKALELYRSALAKNNKDPHLNLKFAHLHFMLFKDIFAIKENIPYALKYPLREKAVALNLAAILAIEENHKERIRELIKEIEQFCPEDQASCSQIRGEIYAFNGDIDNGVKEFLYATKKDPSLQASYDNLVMMSHYSKSFTSENILNFAKDYYREYIKPFREKYFTGYDFSKHLETYKENQVIKIGFVSGDLKMHPVFFWVSSLFKNLPKENLKIYCYVNNPKNEFSESLKQYSCSVNYIKNLSDKELAEKIYQDAIHVLVDLSGHTTLNRLRTFSLKPAPLQITWLGQTGPLGLPEIDYMLTDSFLVKKGEENLFTEKICRLPNLFAPYPAKDYKNIFINTSLARQDGVIVLGSLNTNMKINTEVLETWAQILNSLPNSVLLMKSHQLKLPAYRKKIEKLFSDFNIPSSRIILEAGSEKADYIDTFSKIDIALDPFPVGGGTTTHETLMMSVPLISIRGNRVAFRGSAAIIEVSGFPELITNSKEEYINKIIELAKSPAKILYYKSIIREKYLNSPATDMKTFAKDFIKALQNMWKEKVSELNKTSYL